MLTLFQNRPAWRLETSELRVTVMQCGGHVAETALKLAGGINPLWIQDRPTIDSDQFMPARDAGRYGDDPEARLISGLLGHNLCFPFWGPPSPSEFAAGMTYHGETNIVRWQEMSHTPNSLTITAALPNSGIRVDRRIVCRGAVVFYETTVENLLTWDRPIAWCEHVTVGPPFLRAEETRFHASLLNGFRTVERAKLFTWPEGYGESKCDLSCFASGTHSDLLNSFKVDPNVEIGCFVAWNPHLGLLFGYAFPARQFPWLNVWESNTQLRRTRGMEFSNTPVEGTLKALIDTPRLLDLPTFEWLDARQQLRKMFVSFSASIFPNYSGVAKVHTVGSVLRITGLAGEILDLDIDGRI